MYIDMLPEHTISKNGVKEVKIGSSGAETIRLIVALSCRANRRMLPALPIFKGKLPRMSMSQFKQKDGWMQNSCSNGSGE